MSVLDREQFLERVRSFVGDNTTDEALEFVADMSDTYEALNTPSDGVDWKARFEENDAQWRAKYRDRFFATSDSDVDGDDVEPPAKKIISFDELFTTKEN